MPFAPVIEKDADLTKVRGHLGEAAQYLIELRARPADKRGDTYADDVRSAIDFINDFDPVERALTASARPVEAVDERGRRGSRGNGTEIDGPQDRTLGGQFVRSDGFEELRTARAGGNRMYWGTDVPEVRTLLGEWSSGQWDTGVNHMLPVNTPTLRAGTLQRRRMFLRDLIGVEETGLSGFTYLRERAAEDNETGAAMTSEGSAKAEVTMLFEPADAPARKITAWIPVTDELLSDAPTLRGYINARLTYMLDIREEAQVYNGDGNAPNLQGLKTVTGVQTQSAVSGDFPATIGQAIGKVELKDGNADGAACHPTTFWVAVTKRHAEQFDNGFGGNAPAAMSGLTWGLPCVRSRIFATNAAMVADWAGGAKIFQREGTRIEVSNSHGTNFTSNIDVIRAERRIALPIWRPDWFVDVTVPTS